MMMSTRSTNVRISLGQVVQALANLTSRMTEDRNKSSNARDHAGMGDIVYQYDLILALRMMVIAQRQVAFRAKLYVARDLIYRTILFNREVVEIKSEEDII